jgi:aryl-alcohol dehydrogenase-like predicted oxidoreductase
LPISRLGTSNGSRRFQGLSRAAVIENARAKTIERALESGAFDVVQATKNLREPSAAAALAAAHDAGLGVIVKEALANG